MNYQEGELGCRLGLKLQQREKDSSKYLYFFVRKIGLEIGIKRTNNASFKSLKLFYYF